MNGVVVDGYSSGVVLANELIKLGCTLYHVQSSRAIPKPYQSSFDPGIYAKNVIIPSLDAISLDTFNNASIEFVIAGSEPGVLLADHISAQLGVAGNSPETSVYRRNKAKMMMRLRECGLQAIEEIVLSQGDAMVDIPASWFPVVVKPVDSAGSDDVRICEDAKMLASAVAHIFNKENILGLPNKQVLIQRKLEGLQYMVNAISQNGVHKIIEIWQERRIHTEDGHSIYDREILMPSDFLHSQQIQIYIKAVLSALGVEFGPSHSELFMTVRGPVLLESAARMQGGIDGYATQDALGYSHISCVRDLLLQPSSFKKMREIYQPRSNVMLVNFISARAGLIIKNKLSETVERLPSYHSSKGVPGPGERIKKTIDLLSKPGHVYLVHADAQQIARDYQAIRSFERNHALFDVKED